jgi:hypothetical protein
VQPKWSGCVLISGLALPVGWTMAVWGGGFVLRRNLQEKQEQLQGQKQPQVLRLRYASLRMTALWAGIEEGLF